MRTSQVAATPERLLRLSRSYTAYPTPWGKLETRAEVQSLMRRRVASAKVIPRAGAASL